MCCGVQQCQENLRTVFRRSAGIKVPAVATRVAKLKTETKVIPGRNKAMAVLVIAEHDNASGLEADLFSGVPELAAQVGR